MELSVKKRLTKDELAERTVAYSRLATAVNVTAEALKKDGSAVLSEAFKKEVKEKIVDLGKTNVEILGLWKIFNGVLEKTKERELFKNGQASITVKLNGRIFRAELKKVKDDEFTVLVDQYYLSEGVLELTPLFREPITVYKMEIPVKDKSGQTEEVVAAKDPETGLWVRQGLYINHDHQVEAILAAVGKDRSANGEIVNVKPISEVKPVQLITAGTGSGKSAILSSLLLVETCGIVAVPKDLVEQMTKEVGNFTGATPTVLEGADRSIEELLASESYIVMSHGELMEHVDKIKGQNIFIDEAHELTTDEDATNNLRQLAVPEKDNRILGVTATPNNGLYEVLGKPIYDLSVYRAQHELKKVRLVLTRDIESEKQKMADDVIIELLARQGEITDEMEGYDVSGEGNTRVSFKHQGMVFTDYPDIAKEIQTKLSGLQDDEKLRGEVYKRTLGKMGQPAEVYEEVLATQRKIVESNIQIEILSSLESSDEKREDKVKKLRELVRNYKTDELNSRYREFVQALPGSDQAKIIEKLEEEKKNSKGILADYYDRAVIYFGSDWKGQCKAIDELHKKSKFSVLLTGDSDADEIKNAQNQVAKGLVMHIVSSGPLGTGYNNKNILNAVVAQSGCIEPGSAAGRIQECGRTIRGNDGFAFVTSVTNKALTSSERNLTTSQVFDKNVIDKFYNPQLERERELERPVVRLVM